MSQILDAALVISDSHALGHVLPREILSSTPIAGSVRQRRLPTSPGPTWLGRIP